VRWKTIRSTVPGWDSTTITFDLSGDGGDTVLSFAHRGFERADERHAMTTTGWPYYLIGLKRYLEVGKGAPHPDDSDHRPFSAKAAR